MATQGTYSIQGKCMCTVYYSNISKFTVLTDSLTRAINDKTIAN